MALTDAGFDLLSTTQALLQQLAVGIRRLEQYRKPNQLVVNTTPAFARHWLVPHLADFHQHHPQIDLWLFTSDEVPDMATQTIDVAVRDDLTAQAECNYRVLLEDRLLPVAHPSVLSLPAEQRTTLHGEREMDWSHWQIQGGANVGQHSQGLNFSDPGLLLDAASQGLGIALTSELLSSEAREQGTLQPLVEQRVRGPRWSWLVHRDSEADPLTVSFCQWLAEQLQLPQVAATPAASTDA